MQKLKAFLLLIRIPNVLLIALAEYFLATLITETWFELNTFLLIASTSLVVMSGNIINDYFDVRFDRINKPHEVWVGTYFSRREILVIHLVVSILSVSLGLLAHWSIALIDTLCVAILWFYSQKLKCIPLLGNLVVALLAALSVFIVGFYFKKLDDVIYAYMYFAFLINLIREITKDVEDLRGDLHFDCKTIPTTKGVGYSKRILISLQTILLLSLILIFKFTEETALIYGLLPLLSLLTFLLIIKTSNAHKKAHFRFLSRILKVIILFGIFTIAFQINWSTLT